MSRQQRKISESGFYHIVFRGVNHCHLFEEDEDFIKLLDILANVKEALALELPAYCLLDNHVHLLIKESSPGDIISAMRKLLSPYAYWFNHKYQRSGALIAERYKSECVETDEYLLTLIRYIHQNPLKAAITDRIDSYPWSSYLEYLNKRKGLADTSFILSMFSSDPASARKDFEVFHRVDNGDEEYSLAGPVRRNEQQVRLEITTALAGLAPTARWSTSKTRAGCPLDVTETTGVFDPPNREGDRCLKRDYLQKHKARLTKRPVPLSTRPPVNYKARLTERPAPLSTRPPVNLTPPPVN